MTLLKRLSASESPSRESEIYAARLSEAELELYSIRDDLMLLGKKAKRTLDMMEEDIALGNYDFDKYRKIYDELNNMLNDAEHIKSNGEK